MGEFGFWLFLSVCVIFTAGKPDLLDHFIGVAGHVTEQERICKIIEDEL